MPPIRCILSWSANLLVVAATVSATSADEYTWHTKRARLRSVRNELRAMAQDDAAHRAKVDAQIVAKLIDVAEKGRTTEQTARLKALAAQVAWLDPNVATPLSERLSKLAEPSMTAGSPTNEWELALADAERELVQRPGELLNRSIELGLFDLAYQFMQEILAFAPSHQGLRASLGHVWHEDRWLTAFEMDRAARGLAWDDRWGWYVKAERARYEAGYYYDLDRDEWTTLDEANEEHASLDRPWTLNTAHLTISGTVELETLAQVASRLEAFYRQVFAAYAPFFARTSQDYRLVLGMADHPPLAIRIFRDADQFGTAFPRRPQWSKGIFDPTSKTSLFIGNADRVMYHEFTHQILHVFTRGNQSPAWLTEGIAVYTQSPVYRDGRLQLGSVDDNPTLQKQFAAFREGRHMNLEELLAIEDLGRWGAAEDPDPQYCSAGALVQFCMEAKDRSYRADFIDFLTDSYRGRTFGHKLWDYLGLDKVTFIEFYQDWLRRTANSSVQQAKPAAAETPAISRRTAQAILGMGAMAMLLQDSPDDAKIAVPEQGTQQIALDVIRKEVHAAEYKRANSRTNKLSLSDTLFREGTETLDDDAARYVLFREATTLSCEGGDIDRALRFIDETARLYRVNALQLKVEALSAANKGAEANPAFLAVANQSLALMEIAAAENEFDLALQMGKIGSAASERVGQRALEQQITAKMRELERVRGEYAAVRASLELLKKKPDDPFANLSAGKYHCFIQGDWTTGLPLLVKGNDKSLRELATLELTEPTDPAAQVKLGDAWWQLGRDATEPTKTHAQARAAYWYRAVVQRLSGLTKSKIQERLKQLEREKK